MNLVMKTPRTHSPASSSTILSSSASTSSSSSSPSISDSASACVSPASPERGGDASASAGGPTAQEPCNHVTLQPCNAVAPTSHPALPTPHSSARRRNGDIARLPKEIRQRVNEMLDDGLTYEAILENLGEHGKDISVGAVG